MMKVFSLWRRMLLKYFSGKLSRIFSQDRDMLNLWLLIFHWVINCAWGLRQKRNLHGIFFMIISYLEKSYLEISVKKLINRYFSLHCFYFLQWVITLSTNKSAENYSYAENGNQSRVKHQIEVQTLVLILFSKLGFTWKFWKMVLNRIIIFKLQNLVIHIFDLSSISSANIMIPMTKLMILQVLHYLFIHWIVYAVIHDWCVNHLAARPTRALN